MSIPYKIGDHVKCVVVTIKPYGAFLELPDNQSGFLHLSCITNSFVSDINDYITVGMELICEVISINQEKNQINLSSIFAPLKIKHQRYSKVYNKTLSFSEAKRRSQFKYVLENMNKILEEK
jgi:predicted RNA-binding protein with RPS1 domain